MTVYEDECVGCATETYPCRGKICPNRNVAHRVCDHCKAEFDRGENIFRTKDGKELCFECMLEEYDIEEEIA